MKSYFIPFIKQSQLATVAILLLCVSHVSGQQKNQSLKLVPNFTPGNSFDISFSWYSEYDAEADNDIESDFDDENKEYQPSIKQLLENQIKRPPQSIGKLKVLKIENDDVFFSYEYERLDPSKILGSMIASLSELPIETKLETDWNRFLSSISVDFVWNKQSKLVRQININDFVKKANTALLELKDAANQQIIEPFLEEKKEAINQAMTREKGFQVKVKNYEREAFLHESYQQDYTQIFLSYAKFITDYAVAEFQTKMANQELLLFSVFPELAYVFDFTPFELDTTKINTITLPFGTSLFLLNAGVHTLEPLSTNQNNTLQFTGNWFLNESQRSLFKERLILYDETLINILLELRNKPFIASGKEEYASLKLDAKGELDFNWDSNLMIPVKVLRKLSGKGLEGEYATYFLFEMAPSKQ